jgi:hypothetical protein
MYLVPKVNLTNLTSVNYILRISNFELHKQIIILCAKILISVHSGAGNRDEVPGTEPLRGRAQRDDHGGQLQEKMSSN